MDVLIIGFSSIVQRRVLPALLSLPEVNRIHLASRQNLYADAIPPEKRGTIYHGYADAFRSCEPCIAYISLPNSLHAEWAYQALKADFHVIVDKPSVTNILDAKLLVDLAEDKKLCLAEANVWCYHPIVQTLKSFILEKDSSPLMALAIFSSPGSNRNTIHYEKELGGGVLFDRGPYAVSCGRIIFGRSPEEIICKGNFSEGKEVDTSCSIILKYGDGSTLMSFLSLVSEYQNSLSVFGKDYRLDTQRIFTPPADYEGAINVTRGNKSEFIYTPTGDTFAMFIQDVLSSIKKRTYAHFCGMLLEDAQILWELRKSVGGE